MQNLKSIWRKHNDEHGGGGSYLLLWLIGIPFPILAIIFLLKGCS